MTTKPTGRPTGPAKTPVGVARKLGNPGKRPLPPQRPAEVRPISAIPDPPRVLGQHGLGVWSRAWHLGSVWIEMIDQDVLLLLCEQYDERSALRVEVMRNGDWRQRSALRAVDAQIMAGLSAIGMTPADRARMGVGELGEADALDELRSRRSG